MAMVGAKVEGLEAVLGALNLEIRRIKNKTKAGMIKGGFRILRRAQELTPINTGNLRSSGFITWGRSSGKYAKDYKGPAAEEIKQGVEQTVDEARQIVGDANMFKGEPTVMIGFGAFYAIYVHEDLDVEHNVGQAKFLQQAVEDMREAVLNDIVSEASTGGSPGDMP